MFRSETHFFHITGNLRSAIKASVYCAKRGVNTEESLNYGKKMVRLYKVYKGLLEKHSAFRTKEISVKEGCFPDIPSSGNGFLENYITDAAKRLETIFVDNYIDN